jgi:hypothetical protein
LCKPPLKLGGNTVNDAFARFPNCSIAAPDVPAWLEEVKFAVSCQHSRIDSLLAAERAVKLNLVGAENEVDTGGPLGGDGGAGGPGGGGGGGGI